MYICGVFIFAALNKIYLSSRTCAKCHRVMALHVQPHWLRPNSFPKWSSQLIPPMPSENEFLLFYFLVNTLDFCMNTNSSLLLSDSNHKAVQENKYTLPQVGVSSHSNFQPPNVILYYLLLLSLHLKM
jgi:hypothetical protein